MKIGAMLGDIVQSLFKKPVTENYPFEQKPAPLNFRGKLTWDAEKCVGCNLCVRECPANALELIVIDKKAKRFLLNYHLNRCIYCAQCEYSCKFDCIDMSSELWELASLSQAPLNIYYGAEEDIEKYLARESRKFADVAVTE
ncbi:MAG: 4Fe-4S binding protein [Anaerolineaceae bacterium]|nr:4Fe-4S binding protein [Anaerolineaceae bacterium]